MAELQPPEYLERGVEMYEYTGGKLEFIDGDGNLDAEGVDLLVPMLAACDGDAERVSLRPLARLGLGAPRIGRRPLLRSRLPAGLEAVEHAFDEAMAPGLGVCRGLPRRAVVGRDMILFDGALEAVSTIGPSNFP